MRGAVMGIDVGGTKVLGGLVDLADDGPPTVLHRFEAPTPRTDIGADPDREALALVAAELLAVAVDRGTPPLAVGVGVPEYVRDDLVAQPEVLAAGRQPRDVVAQAVAGVPVRVGADVWCAALGETRARADDAAGSLFYLSWGTGISSALVLEGTPLEGRRGEALALGEWPVATAVDRTWAGNLEQYAAGRSLGLRYAQETGTSADGREVIARAAGGDPVADRVVESAALAVAHALAQVVLLLDPDLVVLGGGLGSSGSVPPRRVAEVLPTLLRRSSPPPVEPAAAGPDAGMIGAALLAAGALPRGHEPCVTGSNRGRPAHPIP